MRILITGNMGYVGPAVIRRLRESYPKIKLIGYDMGYFASCLTASPFLPECRVDVQHLGDVRSIDPAVLDGVDAIIYLAAISNDPMGATFEKVTWDVNCRAAVHLARNARERGVRRFIFASSCSVYGSAEQVEKTEESALNPLTAYAKSKIGAEEELGKLADSGFGVTSLRFSTACGMSERLRLDLVLNDFVASAVTAGRITILSDGTPWRPLIHVLDMARAIEWALGRTSQDGGEFLAINVGSDEWNYQVRDLAEAVAQVVTGVRVDINRDAQPDKRSYRVSFEKFRRLAKAYQPQVDLRTAIEDLIQGLQRMNFRDSDFRQSHFMRLNVLKQLKQDGHLTEDLSWSGFSKCIS
ncbi:MAG TPA: SDR family oxidoreductase [Nitrospiraceae bacterium]|nr:SDR family oxidoreductase [Nitrospiraceae bacterium]